MDINIYESRLEVLAKYKVEDLLNPLTQETIIKRLEAIDTYGQAN